MSSKVVKELKERAKQYQDEVKTTITKGQNLHRQFKARFPFDNDDLSITNLTEEDIYNPGSGDYFFYWIEHKLKVLGHISMGSSIPFRNASEDLPTLRELIRTTVDSSKKLHEKVDAPWDKIKGLGGDRHVAKKIIFLYNKEHVYPIFKTEHFEYFLNELGINRDEIATNQFAIDYSNLSLGKKFEVLQTGLREFQKRHKEFREWDTHTFSRLLYREVKPPSKTYGKIGQSSVSNRPLGKIGLLYEPSSEMEVIVLFSMYHRELGFPYILTVRSNFPDAIVLDETGEQKSIEFELFSKSFQAHGHELDKCVYIVCWEDNWRDASEEIIEKIIPLNDRLKDILE